ncbi:unnamed protein product [Calypogeia fissa]
MDLISRFDFQKTMDSVSRFDFHNVLDSVLDLIVHHRQQQAEFRKDRHCPAVAAESNYDFISIAVGCYACYVPILAVAVHSIFFMVIAVEHVKSLSRPEKESENKKKEFAKLHSVAKFVSVALLILDIARLWLSAGGASPSKSAFALYSTEAVAWLTISFALQREESKGRAIYRNILKYWWVAFVVLSGIAFTFAVLIDEIVVAILDFAPLVSSLFLALGGFSGYVYSEKRVERNRGIDDDVTEPLLGDSVQEESVSEPTPVSSTFSRANFVSVIAFLWLNPLLNIGIKRPLKITDVPLLDQVDAPNTNYEAFREEWKREIKGTAPGEIPSMRWTLFKTFWRPFVISMILVVLLVLAQFVAPLVQMRLIMFMEQSEHRTFSTGFTLVMTLLLGKVAESTFGHQLNFRSRKLGLQMWSAVGCAVYNKALRLSLKARQGRGVGEITNMMSSDLQRLLDLIYYIQQGFVIPLQITLAVIILFNVVGVAMLSGLASLVLVLFINSFVVQRLGTYRAKLLIEKDKRMRATTECLGNLKVIKLQTWDDMFKDRINKIREVEKGWVWKFMLTWGYAIFMVWNGPLVLSGATFVTMVLIGQPLTADRVYTALTTFKIIQEPIRVIPDIIANIFQATVSIHRIGIFLMEDEVDEGAVERNPEPESDYAVEIEGATFCWDKDEAEMGIIDLSLKVKKGSCVAICGGVGSGKSSLLYCIMGELPRLAGTAKLSGRLAYVAQSAWIQNDTIKENILFGRAMDKDRYTEAVRVSGLVADLAQFPDGDETEIGERGTSLSGGQKQRVQLARAVYQDADVYLLDDPFSAVDAHTGTFLFEECVKGALKGKTVILVTHQVEFLPAVDQIIVMRAPGAIVQQGTYSDLVQEGKDFGAFVDALQESLQNVISASQHSLGGEAADMELLPDSAFQPLVSGGTGSPKASEAGGQLSSLRGRKSSFRKSISGKNTDVHTGIAKQPKGKLIQEEIRAVGRVNRKVVIGYLTKVAKGSLWTVIFASQIGTTVILLLSDLWLAAGTSTQKQSMRFMYIYCTYLAAGSLSVFLRTTLIAYTGVATAQAFFTGMLNSIIRAPMSFMDSTPVGRILSRFSTDQTALDMDLTFKITGVSQFVTSLFATMFVTIYVTPQILLLTIPLGYLFIKLQVYFITSSRELSRLTSISEAPVFLHISESVWGAISIRAFENQSRFSRTNVVRLEAYQRAYFHNMTAAEWLGFRLDSLSAAVLSCVAILLITVPEGTISPGLAGMALSYGMSLSAILMRLVTTSSMAEVQMVSVERIMQYSNLPSEAPTIIPDRRPPSGWPNAGRIELQHLQLRYRPDLPLVLKGVSCVIRPREKVGVVGRTGSGKSTLIQALFRLIEPSGGRILIDGLDITTIGLNDLRSALGVIPQEPTLFEGSVRSNLDPFNTYSDLQMWEALDKCQLGRIVRDKPQKLDSAVTEQGDNWSVGERQLLCLGRALLRQTRILVLDEATASVDITTDALIQLAIKKYFTDCTVISVAHRIPSVIDSDRVLVLDNGHLMENNSPENLLANENSMFSKLVKEYTSRTESNNNLADLGLDPSTVHPQLS